jgi:hypothetical protein
LFELMLLSLSSKEQKKMKKFTTVFLYVTYAINVMGQLPESFDLSNFNKNNFVIT